MHDAWEPQSVSEAHMRGGVTHEARRSPASAMARGEGITIKHLKESSHLF
jgi:hypothetical protein